MTVLRQGNGAYEIDGVADCRPSLLAARLALGGWVGDGVSPIVCGEIGVHRGSNAARIKAVLHPARFFLIDVWRDIIAPPPGESRYVDAEDDRQQVLDMFDGDPAVMILQADSRLALPMLVADSMDYLYIDGDHSRDVCFADILEGIRLVRCGGILGGHDYGRPSGFARAAEGGGGVEASVSIAFDGLYVYGHLSDWWVPVTLAVKKRAVVLRAPA